MLNRSLHVKLFCTSLFGAAAVLALLLGSISYIAFEFALKKNAALVDSIVRENAKEVEVQLGVGWTVAESVARLAVSMKEQQLSRDVVNAVTKNLLEANAQLAGLGHYWEANAFDGKDSDFVNQPSHDSTGRYLVYWSRSGGGVKPEVLTGYSTENPSNQYYYKPLRSHISWASEPFSYNDASGRPQMMVSLMVPLLVKGRALGVGGVDIPLETISRQLKKIEIFKGYGALVSSEGLYASHPDPDRWGKSATELPAAALEAIQSGRPYSFVRNGWKYTLESVRIGKAPNNWALMVAYPQAEALAEINHFVLVSVLIGAVGLLLLACALWFLLGWQIRPLSELTKGIEAWQGELTLEFEQRGSDETGKLAAAFNAFIKRLNGLVYSIRQSSTTLAQISDHLGDTTHAVADRAASQHTATEEMANGVTALAHSVTELSQQAEDVEHLARETEALTTQISTEMTQTLEGITHIDSTMDLVSGAVSDLEGRSQQIAGIIAVIRSIAEQTNLLALNAAIEAARAGEQGRGFAVVADEVRQLAERTSKSTGEIGEMIGAIGSDVRNTVNNVQLVSVAVSHSVAQLTDSAEGVQQIRQHAQDILGRISEVARQTQSQAATGEELSVAIQGVSRIAGENDHAIRDLLDQSSKLRNQAGSLNNQLTQFKN